MGSGAPFFGRAAELALLSAQAAAANTGEGRVVLIGGEPGIGKTRLAGEATARAAAAGMRCVRSLCASLDGAAPAGPLTRREGEIAGLVARGAHQPADRRGAAHLRADRGEPRPAHPGQARPAHPHPDRRLGGRT